MKRITKHIIAGFMAVLLIITILPARTFAEAQNTPKEEVVYINLNADGSVKEILVVNIFDLAEDGTIIDYGEYVSIRNMTGTEAIDYRNNTVTIDAGAGKLYYEGRLKESAMPWNISIRYFMDGTEYTADDIAGMSGRLEITISVKQNPDCVSSFFEGYALQASVTLDTKKASNIQAEGATEANVGSDKQLTFTILPDTEKDFTVSADVKDYEMGAISINGIRMNMDIEINDDTLQEKIDEVIDAVNELDKGAGELFDGTNGLCDAAGELNSVMKEFHLGAGSLCDGAGELKTGLMTIISQSSELTGAEWEAYEALCMAAQAQLNETLTANGMSEVTLTPSTYSEVLLGVLAMMDADTVYEKAYNAALAEVSAQVGLNEDALYAGYVQSNADNIYLAYVQSQEDALYRQVAGEAVVRQLIERGFSREDAENYIATPQGSELVDDAVAAMTDEQKRQIIENAAANLTDARKTQILQGAVASLTVEQKKAIKNAYIDSIMSGDEVTGRINEAVESVNASAGEITALKGQLDRYGLFYKGLLEYTEAVKAAADGATEIADGMEELYGHTGEIKDGVGELNDAVGTLKDGVGELKNGTEEFASKTDGMDEQISDEIDSIKSSITGENVETVSFVSEKNTNIKSVQFVIQTEKIAIEKSADETATEAPKLTFWQKLLRLFGLY